MPLRAVEGHRAPPLLNDPAQGQRRVAHGKGMVEGGKGASQNGGGQGAVLRVAAATSSITGQCCRCSGLRRLGVPCHAVRHSASRTTSQSVKARCWSRGKATSCGQSASRQSACSASIPL